MHFHINLTQLSDFLCVSFNAFDSQVLSYTPFHFSFTVPLKRAMPDSKWNLLNLYLFDYVEDIVIFLAWKLLSLTISLTVSVARNLYVTFI